MSEDKHNYTVSPIYQNKLGLMFETFYGYSLREILETFTRIHKNYDFILIMDNRTDCDFWIQATQKNKRYEDYVDIGQIFSLHPSETNIVIDTIQR